MVLFSAFSCSLYSEDLVDSASRQMESTLIYGACSMTCCTQQGDPSVITTTRQSSFLKTVTIKKSSGISFLAQT